MGQGMIMGEGLVVLVQLWATGMRDGSAKTWAFTTQIMRVVIDMFKCEKSETV
jgi:hypothetical protein